jgi:hypothetical protein
MGTTAADRTGSSVLVAAALFSVLACGGSSSPAPDPCAGVQGVCGTARGAPFLARSSVGIGLPTTTCPEGVVGGLSLGFSAGLDLNDPANLCREAARASYVGVLFLAYDPSQPGTPIPPGTYAVSPAANSGAMPYVYSVDASCRWLSPNLLGRSGSVTIDSIDAARVAGSLDVTFSDGSRVRGRFDAPLGPAAPDTCAVFDPSAGSVPAGCPGGVTCLPAAP